MSQTPAGDRFVLERQVAAGAMGAVFKAWDRKAGEPVAVKLLHAENAQQARRFEREAELLSTLSHPAIVRYVTHGTNPAGERFLVMEWLEGETLEERLARKHLTAAESVRLLERVLEGCAAAHLAGIVHRDIKPSNLLLVGNQVDKVKIADFGIARRLSDRQRLTLPGVVIGTPLYMSPEQARGDLVTDARTDVFSLGCVLFECLTGQPPFVGTNLMAILAKIILESPTSLRDLQPHLPESLERIVAQMLIKDGAARPEALVLTRQLRAIERDLAALGEGPATAGPRRTASIPSVQALGKRGEQRVICVVLVAGQAPPAPQLPGFSSREAATVDAPAPGRMAPRRVVDALIPFGARLDQLLDGSMIITLSGSLTPTNQAVQAARCALTLRSLIADSPMALCTGRAVLGGQLPIGAVIDNGVRLLEMSGAGTVHVDEATASLLQGRFVIAGGERPELRHELLDDEAPRTLLGKPTPFLGRERDLETLERTFLDCIDESSARAVLVTAPAGAGKSRLRHEFLLRLREGGPEFQLIMGRADSMHSGSPYGLLAPALRRLVGIDDDDRAEVKREKVAACIGRRLPPEKATRVVEFVGELMGVSFADDRSSSVAAARHEPRLMADQILASWLDWLEAECQAGPVLVVLEDLQWGDFASVQLLDAALRALEGLPLMVAGFAGPEIEERFPNLFRQRALLSLRLGRLGRKSCEKLIVQTLGNRISAAKREKIIDRADGNAFYLEQMIIAIAAGRSESELPDSVLGMVQARVDGLGDQGKRVLRAASVYGESFDQAGVRALLGGDRSVVAVEDWLPVLIDQEIIDARGDFRQGQLVFRSSLLRDAAYAMLPEHDRVLGHRLAANWLQDRGDVPPLILAEHYERGQDAKQASTLYCLAAEKALEANDLALAISCVDRGVACGATGDVFGNLMLLRAEAHECSGDLSNAESEAKQALSYVQVGSPSWYRASEALVSAVAARGDSETAQACGESMLAQAQAAELDPPRMISMLLAAMSLMLIDRVQLAGDIVSCVRQQSAGRTTERTGGYLHAVDAHLAQVKLADPSSFLRHTRIAMASFQLAGDIRLTSWQQVNLGFGLIEVGLYSDAKVELEEVMSAADRIGIGPFSASARQNLGLVYYFRRSLESAEAMLNAAIELFGPQNDLRQEGTCRMYLARVLVARGLTAGAELEVKKSLELLTNFPGARVVALATLAHVQLADGRPQAARETALACMDLFKATGSVDESESFVRLVHVRALQASGELKQAHDALLKAEARILERAANMSELAVRSSFLQNVPDNRATLELAEAWRESTPQASGEYR
jgi:tetratricopeptide (TPR) repeat protein/predicted Ser/Thr protein kinase